MRLRMRRRKVEMKFKRMGKKKKDRNPEDRDCPGRDPFLSNNWCVEHMKGLVILATIGWPES